MWCAGVTKIDFGSKLQKKWAKIPFARSKCHSESNIFLKFVQLVVYNSQDFYENSISCLRFSNLKNNNTKSHTCYLFDNASHQGR